MSLIDEHFVKSFGGLFPKMPGFAEVFAPKGTLLTVGDLVIQRKLSDTLELIGRIDSHPTDHFL